MTTVYIVTLVSSCKGGCEDLIGIFSSRDKAIEQYPEIPEQPFLSYYRLDEHELDPIRED
jgi:hypothetical protein